MPLSLATLQPFSTKTPPPGFLPDQTWDLRSLIRSFTVISFEEKKRIHTRCRVYISSWIILSSNFYIFRILVPLFPNYYHWKRRELILRNLNRVWNLCESDKSFESTRRGINEKRGKNSVKIHEFN